MKIIERKTQDKLAIAAIQQVKERRYWLNQLSGAPTKSNFPVDHKTGPQEIRLHKKTFNCIPGLYQQLKELTQQSYYTLNVVLQAGLFLLLYRYTGEDDLMIGTPVYRQETAADLINTVLPMRIRLDRHRTFKELLLQSKDTLTQALEHYGYPQEILVKDLNYSTPGVEFPLFDIAVMLENIHEKKYLQHININMIFSFLWTDNGLTGVVEFNTFLYEKSTIDGIIGYYMQLLSAAISHLHEPISRLDMLSEAEREQILYDFNNHCTVYSQNFTLPCLFEKKVDRHPHRAAVVFNDSHLSYRALNDYANQLAVMLRKKGVSSGSIVGVMLEPSIELIGAIIAILKAGGAYFPIEIGTPQKRMVSLLNDCDAALLLTKEEVIRNYSFASLSLRKPGPGDVTPFVTAPRQPVKDFDGLPFPDRTLIDYEKYNQYIGIAMVKNTVSLQATRGCPYDCAFCHKIWPKQHVMRSSENIFEEIQHCYHAGFRRFVFIDDIFNLHQKNSTSLLKKIINRKLDIQLFFPNGLRGDLLTGEFIDLMIEAGTVNIDLALESASPRIQKLIKKNLDIERFAENLRYITSNYPQVLLEMELMIGFPTETEEEALLTLEFLKQQQWVHFPNLNLVKIYPNTDLYQLALEKGISRESIECSINRAYHELPDTLPFSKNVVKKYQSILMNDYFLLKERLIKVLPLQMKTLTREELVQKYDSYLPGEIKSIADILELAGISSEELPPAAGFPGNVAPKVPKVQHHPSKQEKSAFAMRILFLDMSLLFSGESPDMLYDMVEEPLGLMYLLTTLNKKFDQKVIGNVSKSRIDFDSFEELNALIHDFKPDLIGIRTLSYYKEFFHRTTAVIRQWGITVPIITGGPYATSDYSSILRDPNVDLAVLGEGEVTVAQLVKEMLANGNKLPDENVLQRIPGIAYIKNNKKKLAEKNYREIIMMDQDQLLKPPAKPQKVKPEPVANISQPGDPVYVISTSGSTGHAKMVMMEHRNLINLLQSECKETNLEFTRVLQFASIGFDVSSQEIFSTLLDGGMLYMIDRETKTMVPQLLDFIGKRALETLYLPPALLKFIFSHHEYMEKFPRSVKHIIAAGEQLIVTDGLRNHMAKNNVYLHNHYGPAETHVVTAFTLAPRDSVDEKPPIGKPIANTAIYLLDPNHNPLPIGIPGELYISSLNVSRGYCNQPELTAEKFLDDPFCQSQPGHHMYRTGDLARWLAQGNIEFLGRMDNQVKIRGFRIEPAEVEAKLLNHREIEDAAVVARDDAGTLELGGGNKYLCAYIVCKGNVEIADLRDYLSIELPDYMIPSYFVYLTEIPLTPNKKVNTRKLPEPKIVSKQGSSLPRDEIDKKVASMWWEILELENTIIGIDTNFFQLGGQSLKATLLLQKIHKEFNVRMTLGEMFKAPTIKGMSTYIKGAIKTSFSPVELAERKEYYHLSSAQKRLYVLQQMELTKTTYNLPINVVLKGKLEKLKLEGTFRALIARHESLRTSFAPVAETPIQLIHDEVAFKVDYYEAKTEKEGKNKVNHLIIPFQLSRAPLLRVGLIEIEENTHILLIDMHHIVADSISQDILVQEFIALYHDRRLPHLKFQYKDYSQWQNGKKAKDILEQQETYWLKTFQGQIPALNLPTDYLRPAIQSFAGSNIGFVIGGEQTKKLKVLAWQEGATLYMTILALYYVFLAKISGQEDIVVGTPVSGRQHSDLDPIVGMFVNTLALRNHPGPEETFAHFLQEVKQQLLEALENQDYPFEELVDKLKITRDTGRNPLFDVMFTFQPQLEYKSTLPEDTALKIELFKSENPTAKFDMALNAVEDEHALHFNIEYSTKLFKKETIDRFAAYFKDIVTTAANNRNVKLKDIEISLELTDSKSTISHEAQGAFEF